MRKLPAALFTALALTATTQANAVIVFDNISRQDFTSSRGAGDSPLAAITVSATQQLNQIGVYMDPTGNANLKFLVFNLGTGALLFSTNASFNDVGLGYYTSTAFTPFQLNPGTTYAIGAISNVAGLWGTNNSSSGNPYSQGGFTASDDVNGNVTNFATPALGLQGGAMIIVRLGVAPIPEPGTIALFAAGLAAMGGVALRRKNAG